jgi:hypothetical protein
MQSQATGKSESGRFPTADFSDVQEKLSCETAWAQERF